MPFKEKSSNVEVTVIPEREEGYAGICVGVVDLGTTERQTKHGPKRQAKTRLFWELPEVRVENDQGEQESMVVSRIYTKTLDSRGDLHKHLSSWRGRPFNNAELESFGFEKLKFAPCSLYLRPYEYEGAQRNGIEQINKWNGDKLTPTKEFWCFDLDLVENKEQCDSEISKFPEWLQDIIKKSDEYGEFIAASCNTPQANPTPSSVAPLNDDDVPF